MNISTLAKILGVSINDLRDTGAKHSIYGFSGRNTRIPYNSAVEVTKILRPEKAEKLQNDDKIYLPDKLKVSDFADVIGKPVGVVVKTLIMNGVMATMNEIIDYDTASIIAEELNVPVLPESPELQESSSTDIVSNYSENVFTISNIGTNIKRPPIVTVMGHVDHGKTTLLDTIRNANVAGGEAGAITQHITSYQITYNNQKITFVDTPGHEAFTAMRARGSQLADFIILMVSATEGPKPQTVEVIERAKLTKTPLIVAINKIDLPTADPERAMQEVAAFGVQPESWGGNTPFVSISAKNNTNIEELLDTILLHSEVADLHGEIDVPGEGVVIESHVDNKLGVLTTVLVTKGSISVGDIIQSGVTVGKVRRLEDATGVQRKTAQITEPVLIVGLPEVNDSGEHVQVHKNAKNAQQAATEEEKVRASKKIFTSQAQVSDNHQLNLVIVADVTGSLEALKEVLLKIPQDQIKIAIKKESVGNVNESDVDFAHVSNSTILAFHTHIHPQAAKQLRQSAVPIVESKIIYEIIQWVEEELLKNIVHEIKIESLGKAEILKIFKSEKASIQIMGGEVKSGKIFANKAVRIWRDDIEIGRMEIAELQRNMSKVNQVFISQQFGISLTGNIKVQAGDTIESIDEIVLK